jgi:hypothetical protein
LKKIKAWNGPSPLPVDCFDEYAGDGFEQDPYGRDDPCEARLRGLTHQQLTDRLNWLSWYQPGIFAAVMDYGQFSDDLAASAGPATDPEDDFGSLDYAEDPVPVCARCGSEIGRGPEPRGPDQPGPRRRSLPTATARHNADD